MTVQLHNITLTLGAMNFSVDITLPGMITTILGQSGSGKTTLLEIIAGLRRPETGFIKINDVILTDVANKLHVPPEKRNIGYVPQDLALLPHLSVRRNLLYGARQCDPAYYHSIVELLEIEPLLDRRTTMLSGGEKQRVAYARAALTRPKLLLLDEPMANLHQSIKDKILPCLFQMCREFSIPLLYVTHDPSEIAGHSDQVMVMKNGTNSTDRSYLAD
ncbi:MAG: ATP-binding cassette domain-containing protein [Verrucomicrobiota bacterium]|nr:ATP-binding cassette domain-containing protein [Verrucomicrobiota bacterium]